MDGSSNHFLALPAEIVLHIASYVCNLALDPTGVVAGSQYSVSSAPENFHSSATGLKATDANEIAIKSAKLFALSRLDSNFAAVLRSRHKSILALLDEHNQRRAKDLAAHFSSSLSIRLKNAWLETWIIGSDELYYTARFVIGVFRDPPHTTRVMVVPPNADEEKRGQTLKLVYDWCPSHRVLIYYRFYVFSQLQSSTRDSDWSILEPFRTSPHGNITKGGLIDAEEYQEETWQASFHHRVGTCSSGRSSLQGLWRSSARYAKFEFYFEVQDGDKRIINDNKGKYYTLTVDGVPGYWSTGTTRYSPHAPCV